MRHSTTARCFITRGLNILLSFFLLSWAAPPASDVAAQQSVNRPTRGGIPLRLKEPRIKPLEEKDWTAVERDLLVPIKAEQGSVPLIYKTLARYPKLFQ